MQQPPLHHDHVARRAHPGGIRLPCRASQLVQQFLGSTYWSDRARLTWLNAHLDLVHSQWFNGWLDASRWSSWYARHPELTGGATTQMREDPWKPPWKTLPPRFRRGEEVSLLRPDFDHFKYIASQSLEGQRALLRSYRQQQCGWMSEANALRTRVHWPAATRRKRETVCAGCHAHPFT